MRARDKGKVDSDSVNEMLCTKFWTHLHSERLKNATHHKFDTISDFDELLAEVRAAEQELTEFDKLRNSASGATKPKSGRFHQAKAEVEGSTDGTLEKLIQRLDKMEGKEKQGSAVTLEALVARIEQLEAKTKNTKGRNKSRGSAQSQSSQAGTHRSNNQNGEIICDRCGQAGHIKIGCRVHLNNQSNGNASQQALNSNQPLPQGPQ